MTSKVFLNVGGHAFETTASTLSRAEYFDALMRWHSEATQPIFLDRDGRYFIYILNFLRGSSVLPDDIEIIKHLIVEADFYNLNDLLEKLRSHQNKILTTETFQRELIRTIRESFSH